MEAQTLSTYLHDHLSGSVAALELMASLEKAYEQTPVGEFLASLRDEVTWERQQLDSLCRIFPLKTALPRKAAAWISEKGLELKSFLDGNGADDFRLFESLEALSVGIAGKRLLWRTLDRLQAANGQLIGPDYGKLVAMSVRQRKALEPFRLEAAQSALVIKLRHGELSRERDRAVDTHRRA